MSYIDSINKNNSKREEWLEQVQQERKEINERADVGIGTITSDPETYAAYLEMQADNLTFTPTNIAIVMENRPEATRVYRPETWGKLGRSIIPDEKQYGIKVFLPPKEQEKNRYPVIGMVYDISQTTGRDLQDKPPLADNEQRLADAIGGFVSASKKTIVFDDSIEAGAYYDPQDCKLYVHPEADAQTVFEDLSREIIYANKHKGKPGFEKAWYELQAESVGYLLCKHYLGDAKMPECSNVSVKFGDRSVKERTAFLESTLSQFNRTKSFIDRELRVYDREQAAPQHVTPTIKRNDPEPELT